MKLAYDLHIHTAASPCGDSLMTPHNIVNMSLLKGLEVIAITDHQTTANCEAVMEVGRQKGLLVIPGIEVECREEFHLIALFKGLKAANSFSEWLQTGLPPFKNRKEIFGEQLVFNSHDEVIEEIEAFLLTAVAYPAEQIAIEVRKREGCIYPAHIDRSSYSILSNLGGIPEELKLDALEISKEASFIKYASLYENYTILQSSDAHYLVDILERNGYLEVDSLMISEILKKIEKKKVKMINNLR